MITRLSLTRGRRYVEVLEEDLGSRLRSAKCKIKESKKKKKFKGAEKFMRFLKVPMYLSRPFDHVVKCKSEPRDELILCHFVVMLIVIAS